MATFHLSLADYATIFLFIAILSLRLISTTYNPFAQFITRWIMRTSACMFITLSALIITAQTHPFSAILLSTFLGYFLVESIYVWWMIKKFSQIDFPLFPKFSTESDTIVWPNGKQAQKIRDEITQSGFKFSETLAIKASSISILISPIFYSNNGNIRLQVVFPNVPTTNKHLPLSFMLTSYLRNGTILVTHNLKSSIALFFIKPFIAKFKNTSSISHLIKSHNKLIKKHLKQAFILSGEDSMQAINRERTMLEQNNLDIGNCEQQEDHNYVNLSFEGRYKLWVSTLRLNYLGI